jgi:hypothetical protein
METTFKIKWVRIFEQSIFIWVNVILYPIALFLIYPRVNREQSYWLLIFVSLYFGVLIIPGLKIFFNYFKKSRKLELQITKDFMRLVDNGTGGTKELSFLEIDFVNVCQNTYPTSRRPWSEFAYIIFQSKTTRLLIPSFVATYSELRKSGVFEKIPENIILIEGFFLPTIP